MPRKKKSMGIGATVTVLTRLVHPSEHIREKYPNLEKDHRFENCVVTGRCKKKVNRKEQTVVTFRCNEIENVVLYAVERYCNIIEEGPKESFFSNHETVVEAEVADEEVSLDFVNRSSKRKTT